MAQVVAFLSRLWADLTASDVTPLPVTREELDAEWCRVYDLTRTLTRCGMTVPATLAQTEARLYTALTLADVDRRRHA